MTDEKQYVIPAGVNVFDYLRSKEIYISAPCGGHGTCGKCKIRLLAGTLSPGESDMALLSEDEIYSGIRLACRANTNTPVRISVPVGAGEKDVGSKDVFFQTSSDFGQETGENKKTDTFGVNYGTGLGTSYTDFSHEYGIAVDIGTTTLAAALMDMTLGKALVTRTSVNRQRIFGADVVSRTEAVLSGKGEDLKRIIERDLCDLTEGMGIPDGVKVSKMVLSGNTTMYHLLMEYDVRGISSYPFEPVSLGGEWFLRDEVFSLETVKRKILPEDCRIYLMPGFSTFVGGDIFSGMLGLDILEEEGNVFFIDIGTNAEMVLKKGDVYYMASAAAGPALEGGNLKWGTGSVAGAICGVDNALPGKPCFTGCSKQIKGVGGKELMIKTISDAAPVGICGTGALEAVYEFLRAGIINEYGTFSEEYLQTGFPLARSAMGEIIGLEQDDIRQIQMAKAAIRSGAETLLEHAGVAPGALDKVYVSGGFGSFLDIKKAAGIGLIPEGMADKAGAVGNTSLMGAGLALTEDIESKYKRMKDKALLVDLANDEIFKDKYIDSINFKTEAL